jgi:hypothetical protein
MQTSLYGDITWFTAAPLLSFHNPPADYICWMCKLPLQPHNLHHFVCCRHTPALLHAPPQAKLRWTFTRLKRRTTIQPIGLLAVRRRQDMVQVSALRCPNRPIWGWSATLLTGQASSCTSHQMILQPPMMTRIVNNWVS